MKRKCLVEKDGWKLETWLDEQEAQLGNKVAIRLDGEYDNSWKVIKVMEKLDELVIDDKQFLSEYYGA